MNSTIVESATLATIVYDGDRELLQLKLRSRERSMNISAFPQRCTRPCCKRHPREAFSTGSWVDAFVIPSSPMPG
jgi:hypothetical protein